MGRKILTQFDSEKDEWYYQDKIYIDPESSDSLYDELKEFRQSLSKEQDDSFFIDRFNELLAEGQGYDEPGRPTGEIRIEKSKDIPDRPDDLNTGGFFDGVLSAGVRDRFQVLVL
jgi:hypothetical protein